MGRKKEQDVGEKKYLKWYNKCGYGIGYLGNGTVYTLVSSFIILYLTNVVGLNAGIIGTLIMVSKFCDGFTDIFFGTVIDHTHTKMGKARPWMFGGFLGNVISVIALFSIPMEWGDFAKYTFFFIWYTMFNAVFYTITNVAFTSLTSLITKNTKEQVDMATIGTMFSLALATVLASVTVAATEYFGGGVQGWRAVAVIYSIVGLVFNTVSVFSIKELSDEEIAENIEAKNAKAEDSQISFWESVKLLIKNKYWIMMVTSFFITGIIQQVNGNIGVFWCTYVLGNASMLGVVTFAGYVPMIIGLMFTPLLLRKFGTIYKMNLVLALLGVVLRILFTIAGLQVNIPFLLVIIVITTFASAPITGTYNAWIAAIVENIHKKTGKRIDGMVFSCISLGTKLGNGIGAGLSGWLLAAGGYINGAAVQPASAINMMQFMYLGIPLLTTGIALYINFNMKVEQDNKRLDDEKIRIISE